MTARSLQIMSMSKILETWINVTAWQLLPRIFQMERMPISLPLIGRLYRVALLVLLTQVSICGVVVDHLANLVVSLPIVRDVAAWGRDTVQAGMALVDTGPGIDHHHHHVNTAGFIFFGLSGAF